MSEHTVAIIDDDDAVCDALALLARMHGYDARTYSSAETFLEGIGEKAHDCVVTDVRMAGMSGIDMLGKMRERGVRSPVIVITGHGNVPMAVAALKAGAWDFIEKPFQDVTIIERIRDAIAQSAPRAHQQAEIEAFRERLGLLSPRERQVMDLVVAGKPNKFVASELGISIRTVEVHRARVMEKLQARNLSELVRMALTLAFTEGGGPGASAPAPEAADI